MVILNPKLTLPINILIIFEMYEDHQILTITNEISYEAGSYSC